MLTAIQAMMVVTAEKGLIAQGRMIVSMNFADALMAVSGNDGIDFQQAAMTAFRVDTAAQGVQL